MVDDKKQKKAEPTSKDKKMDKVEEKVTKEKASKNTKSETKAKNTAKKDAVKDVKDKTKQTALVVKDKTLEKSKKFNEDYIEGTKLDGTINRIDRSLGFVVPKRDYQYDNPSVQAISGPLKFGMRMFIIVFVFLLGWALIANINSAAVATGTVVVDGSRKIIDHKEGGIVAEIKVRDGDFVEKGQVLVRLNETEAKARRDINESRYMAALAEESRYKSERDELDNIRLHEEILANKDDPKIKELIDSQTRLFDTRRQALVGKINVSKQKTKQLEEEIEGLKAQETSIVKQLELIQQELADVQQLFDKGQIPKSRLLALQRKEAELIGRKGEFKSLIAKAGQTITENELSIINLRTEYMSKVISDLRQTQSQVSDYREQLTAAKDVMQRVEITAPQSGIITGLAYHTIGGTIPPSAEIMSIIPQDNGMIIEAQVNPQDINSVHEGLHAQVRLTAYSARKVPPLKGVVEHLSADRYINEATGIPYFLARVRIDDGEIEALNGEVELYPGMPADVMIVTGERTLLEYMFGPITSAIWNSLNEE